MALNNHARTILLAVTITTIPRFFLLVVRMIDYFSLIYTPSCSEYLFVRPGRETDVTFIGPQWSKRCTAGGVRHTEQAAMLFGRRLRITCTRYKQTAIDARIDYHTNQKDALTPCRILIPAR